jgi:hypothetical protein
MARGRQWGDDSSTQIKFAGGGSVSVIFRGNLFDLLPNERTLIADLSSVIQRFNEGGNDGGKARDGGSEVPVQPGGIVGVG